MALAGKHGWSATSVSMRMITRPQVLKLAMAAGLPKYTCLWAPKSSTVGREDANRCHPQAAEVFWAVCRLMSLESMHLGEQVVRIVVLVVSRRPTAAKFRDCRPPGPE